ncbi:MAG: hypothetical protein KC561_02495 [Myxococcales bacterium]|nr:hypothetical protein [Myxococcales bacterium]
MFKAAPRLAYVLVLTAIFAATIAGCGKDPAEPDEPTVCSPGGFCQCTQSSQCAAGEFCISQICQMFDPQDVSDDTRLPDDLFNHDRSQFDTQDSTDEDGFDRDGTFVDASEVIESDLTPDESNEDVDLGPPACADDFYEFSVNDTFGEAAEIEATEMVTNLVSCPEDDDWFEVDLRAHEAVSISVTSDETLAGVDLFGESELDFLATGTAVQGGFQVDFTTVLPRTVRLKVSSGLERVEYEIETVASNAPCTDDVFDQAATPNDTRLTATPITPGVQDAVMCIIQSEQDWYSFEVGYGQVADVRVEYVPADVAGNLYLSLYEGDTGGADYDVIGSNGSAVIETEVLEPGTWKIAVLGVQRFQGDYQLSVRLTDIPGCSFDVAHEPDNTEGQADDTGLAMTFDEDGVLEEAEDFEALLLCDGEAADYYAIDLGAATPETGEWVTFSLQTFDGSEPFDVRIYPKGESYTTSLPVAWEAGAINHEFLARGRWHFVRVAHDGNPTRTPYSVSASVIRCDPVLDAGCCAMDRLERNDSPAEATSVSASELDLDLCQLVDREDWFVRSVNTNRTQTVSLNNQADGPLSVDLFQPVRVPLDAQCQSDSECDEGAICLREFGCTTALATAQIQASSTGNLVYSTVDSGDFWVRVVPEAETDSAEYDLSSWSTAFDCPVDQFANNHDAGSAAELSLPGSYPLVGSLCNNRGTGEVEPDYFHVEVPANTRLEVTMTTEPGQQVSLYVPCSTPSPVVSSTGFVSAFYTTGGALEDVCISSTVLPTPVSKTSVGYSLYLSQSASGSCLADSYEPNDSIGAASQVNALETWRGAMTVDDLTLCGEDGDYFVVSLERGTQFIAGAAVDPGDSNDVDLLLFGPCDLGCEQITTAFDVSTGNVLNWTVSESGRYVVGVRTEEEGLAGPYRLLLHSREACSADPYEDNNDIASATPGDLFEDEPLTLCADGTQPDLDYFEYQLAGGTHFVATAEYLIGQGDVRMVLWRGSEQVATGLGAQGLLTLDYSVERGGLYWLEIYSPSRANVPYALSTTVEALPCDGDEFEPNDEPALATLLLPGTYSGLRHCRLDDDWYRIEVPSGQRIYAALTSQQPTISDSLSLELFRPSSPPPTTPWKASFSGGGVQRIVADAPPGEVGPYYLHVSQLLGQNLSQDLDYELTIGLVDQGACPPDLNPTASDPDNAPLLGPEGRAAETMCDGDEDWWRIPLLPGQSMTVQLVGQQSDGVEAALYRNPGASPVSGPGSFVGILAGDAEIFYLGTEQDTASLQNYGVVVDISGGTVSCGADNDSDDVIGTANPISEEFTAGDLCDAVDIFAGAATTEPSHFAAELFFLEGDDAPTLDVVDSEETVLGSALPIGPGRLAVDVPLEGDVTPYVVVGEGAGYSGPYWLRVVSQPCLPSDVSLPQNTRRQGYVLCGTGDAIELSRTSSGTERYGLQLIATDGAVEARLRDSAERIVAAGVVDATANPKGSLFLISSTEAVSAEVRPVGSGVATIDLRPVNATDAACTDTLANRSYDTATSISVGSGGQEVCTYSDDWYQLDTPVPAGGTFHLTVTHDPSSADLDIEIYSAPGELAAASYGLATSEMLSVEFAEETTPVVRVLVADTPAQSGYRQSGLYDLALDVEEADEVQ